VYGVETPAPVRGSIVQNPQSIVLVGLERVVGLVDYVDAHHVEPGAVVADCGSPCSTKEIK
jgi:hypothetical protein